MKLIFGSLASFGASSVRASDFGASSVFTSSTFVSSQLTATKMSAKPKITEKQRILLVLKLSLSAKWTGWKSDQLWYKLQVDDDIYNEIGSWNFIPIKLRSMRK